MRGTSIIILSAVFVLACGDSERDPGAAGGSGGSPEGGSGSGAGTASGGQGGTGGSDSGTNILFPSLVLHAEGASLVSVEGTPVQLQQGISCCGGGYGWPLVDSAWLDLVSGQGINWLHMRLGPWRAVAGGEEDWAQVGGAYVESGGGADLTQFNPAFWAAVEAILVDAGNRGIRVELDLADGWGLKHAQADDYGPGWPYHPWSAWNNLQGEDWVTAAAGGTIPAGSVWDTWVRKIAQHTCGYGNITLEDGNEIALKPGYVTAWSTALAEAYWDECAALGFEVHDAPYRPVFGTNSGSAGTIAEAAVGYSQWHQPDPVNPASCGGKPCGVNEYNPNPALGPNEVLNRICEARAAGTWFAYWRHGQQAQAMTNTLALIQQGCGS